MQMRIRGCLAALSTAAVLVAVPSIGITPASAGQCGEFRWPVKSLADPDRHDVDFSPRKVSLARLYRLDPPDSVTEDTPRIEPQEKRTYKVKARLVKAEIEGDTDVKIVVAIPSHRNMTMAMEFLGRPCMTSHFKRHKMLTARKQFLAKCGPLDDDFTRLRGRVLLTGVGFWGSRDHNEIGGAPNAFELIPLLGFRGTCRQR
jgi:hypothetical protein